VSADVTTDPKTGANYYTARVSVSEEEIARLGGAKLMAGMPVEVFVQTNPRTVISYLVRPLSDQVERAFRERWTRRVTSRFDPWRDWIVT
jgi:HlyD family secretion protein